MMSGYRGTVGYLQPQKRERRLTRWEWVGLVYGVFAGLLILARTFGLLVAAPAWVGSPSFTNLLLAIFWLAWAYTLYERARASRDDDVFRPSALKNGAALLAAISVALIAFDIYDLTQGAN